VFPFSIFAQYTKKTVFEQEPQGIFLTLMDKYGNIHKKEKEFPNEKNSCIDPGCFAADRLRWL
jgi:hypothetical protein